MTLGCMISQSLNRALKRHTFIFFQRFKICLPISVRLNSFDILESKKIKILLFLSIHEKNKGLMHPWGINWKAGYTLCNIFIGKIKMMLGSLYKVYNIWTGNAMNAV